MVDSEVTAIVLAGGGSTRMGQNKALLKLGNKTMIETIIDSLKVLFEHILVITNHPEEYNMLKNVKFVKDCVDVGEKNSLIGLYSGLKQSETAYTFAIGCDMPFVHIEFIQYMMDSLKDEAIIVPYINGFYEPLYAIYSKDCLGAMDKLIQIKNYRISAIFENVPSKKVTYDEIQIFDSSLACFKNINTYDVYLKTKHIFESI